MSCGPAVAVVARALVDPSYGARLTTSWFAAEQGRLHADANQLWPRALGMTPWDLAKAIGAHGVRYRWRFLRRHDSLSDVVRAVRSGRPVAMLVGNVIPRHWVLLIEIKGEALRCYEPSSGGVRPVSLAAVRAARLTWVGFPRAFALVLPRDG